MSCMMVLMMYTYLGGTYDVYVVRRENVTGSLQGWDKGNM